MAGGVSPVPSAFEKASDWIIVSGSIAALSNLDCGPVYYFLDLDYTFYSVLGFSTVYSIDTVQEIYNDSVYTYIDKRKVSVDTVNYIMAIDSIQYFTPNIGQDDETHAKIFF